jgi:hypothetical protein
MHEKILLNLLEHDLIFDIVFVLNFDQYLDLIPIQSKIFIKKEKLINKNNKPQIKVDKHLQVSLLELLINFLNQQMVVKQSLFLNH